MSRKFRRRELLVAGAGAALWSLGGRASAQDAAERGFAVAQRSDTSDNGFRDNVASLRMTLRNANGSESQRELEIRTLERASANVGDKSIVIFSAPADIEGTALLSHARILEPDDQWIYLPALHRVRRIASVNKSGPFVGSEFAFEDFTAQELGKFRYNFMRAENLDGVACDVIERFPLYQHSGYRRQIVWIDQPTAQFRKIDFYDRGDRHLKTLLLDEYRQHGGAYWRAGRLRMSNHLTRKTTTLAFSNIRFRTGLSEANFVPAVLATLR
ncbi:MAG TPA: outer membrane lipoprotein-sorting protein [Vitreimonas sp.]|uniref:outer membrane lipoprotein-sorting protein n=1 Tax=Vitreimonas sp. TaxID=3069702 RepID=UPI002D4A467C|nr:outer membrane lipoprotein-sorting protein [Vitreimonas sp.]HYD86927.1 outer membrane lipoprotein-sorting protein [Vitreimonas sp.]